MYSDIILDRDSWEDQHEIKVSCTITNTGSLAGAEVLQLYIISPKGKCFRPLQELKGFEKVYLEAGESKMAEFKLDARAFSYYDIQNEQFEVENGRYQIRIGASSRDIRLENVITSYSIHYTKLYETVICWKPIAMISVKNTFFMLSTLVLKLYCLALRLAKH